MSAQPQDEKRTPVIESSKSPQEERDFFDDFAHELKTPLTSIIASWSLLSEELDLGAENPLSRLVDNIGRSAKYMKIKIDELLDLAKMRIKNLDLQKKPLDMKLLLQEIVDQFSAIIEGKKQTIDLGMPQSLPTVQADRKRIEQILFNLLSNASRFTPRGGTINVSSKQNENGLIIEVKDAGPSIPQGEIDRLLDPKYHLETDRQRFPGLGIGFALAKHLVEMHKGDIWIKSEGENGNTFAFSLPL